MARVYQGLSRLHMGSLRCSAMLAGFPGRPLAASDAMCQATSNGDCTVTFTPNGCLLQVLLHLVIPGAVEQGTQLPNGKKLKYKLTGITLRKAVTQDNDLLLLLLLRGFACLVRTPLPRTAPTQTALTL